MEDRRSSGDRPSRAARQRGLILAAVALAVCLQLVTDLLHGGSVAMAGGSDGQGNGWSAGGRSDEIVGHVGFRRYRPGRRSSASRYRTRRTRATPAAAAAEAWKVVRLPAPAIVANPEPVGLAGMESRFWATGLGPLDQEVSTDGLAVWIHARPRRVVWDLGGATAVTAPHETPRPGDPDPSGGAAVTFGQAGPKRIHCTVEWDVWWAAYDGQTGSVDGRMSETERVYEVEEVRSVLVPPGTRM